MTSYSIGKNKIEIWEGTQTVRITFPDGTTLNSAPYDSPENRKMCKYLGYGNDLWKMCKEHDPLHIFLAVANGKETSRALLRAAKGLPADDADRIEEELVLRYQKH